VAIVDARSPALRRAILDLHAALRTIDVQAESAAPPEASDALDRVRALYAGRRRLVAAVPRSTPGRASMLAALARVDGALGDAADLLATPSADPAQAHDVRDGLQAAFNALQSARRRLG
jgi:hypothetical protein